MASAGRVGDIVDRSLVALGTARMTAAISLTAACLAFSGRFVRALIGWPGYAAALTLLVLLAVASLLAKRSTLEWRGVLPVSLMLFVGWCAITGLWSNYQWSTLGGVLYQLAYLALGMYIALARDLIQIVRVVGDASRFVLVLSLALEVFSGLLIDMPIRFLGIEGNLGSRLAIQGIFGSRNTLGAVALIAAITFAVEFATRSVTRTTSGLSIALAALSLVLTRSPVIFGAALAVLIATALLILLRRLKPAPRRLAQWVLLGATSIGIVVVWVLRMPILQAINAGSEFEVRYALWQRILDFVSLRPLEGWGWSGSWRTELQPFQAINAFDGRTHGSALNAYLDVWFQTGLVGLFCFIVLCALVFIRSWRLAANQRVLVYIWPALTLVALLVISLAESTILTSFGWMIFVACAVAAADRLSWRSRFKPAPQQDLS